MDCVHSRMCAGGGGGAGRQLRGHVRPEEPPLRTGTVLARLPTYPPTHPTHPTHCTQPYTVIAAAAAASTSLPVLSVVALLARLRCRFVNSCPRLREAFPCERGCTAGELGADLPNYVMESTCGPAATHYSPRLHPRPHLHPHPHQLTMLQQQLAHRGST